MKKCVTSRSTGPLDVAHARDRLTRLQQSVAERFGAQHSEQSDEHLQAARDVDLRRGGLTKLQGVTQTYVRNMSKRKDADTAEGKLLPIDALGAVAIEHGDEFGRDSAYGQALVAFGTAQRAMARAQEQCAFDPSGSAPCLIRAQTSTASTPTFPRDSIAPSPAFPTTTRSARSLRADD
jgi:hypothetical protein